MAGAVPAPVAPGLGCTASASTVILHALRLDWEPLQLRFWPAAVADALLGLVDGTKALSLAGDECLRPFEVAGVRSGFIEAGEEGL